MTFNKSFIFFILASTLSLTTQAKVFRNAYVSFELPDSWKCNLEQTEWVCRSEQAKESKEAIIILTAKEVGPTDSFSLYEQHLNAPVAVAQKGGGTVDSKVVYKAKTAQINDQQWLDALQMGSEVNNYFTRYLATIKEKIAILVTFSAHKEHYAKYSQDFIKAVMSLRVIASKNLLAKPDMGGLRPGSETLGPGGFQGIASDLGAEDPMNAKKKDYSLFIALGLILVAVAGYVVLKMKKK